MQTAVFNVSEIDNSNTATTVKNAINSVQGVSNVSVDINTSKVTITFDPSATDISSIKNAISSTGHYVQ